MDPSSTSLTDPTSMMPARVLRLRPATTRDRSQRRYATVTEPSAIPSRKRFRKRIAPAQPKTVEMSSQ